MLFKETQAEKAEYMKGLFKQPYFVKISVTSVSLYSVSVSENEQI